jgi:hypothetical protein
MVFLFSIGDKLLRDLSLMLQGSKLLLNNKNVSRLNRDSSMDNPRREGEPRRDFRQKLQPRVTQVGQT